MEVRAVRSASGDSRRESSKRESTVVIEVAREWIELALPLLVLVEAALVVRSAQRRVGYTSS
jgi:hypothetical protein